MKGFSTRNGDVVVDKTIELAEGNELIRQKVELLIGTNKGEWSYDLDEGIDFTVLLCKNPDDEEIRATIEDAIRQKIDETFTVTEYSRTMEGRKATITFTAVNDEGEQIEGGYTYAS